jgi:hypothetical protein
MTRVKTAKMTAKKPVRRSTAKRISRPANGRRAAIYTLDSTSKSFDSDLVRVFKANVTRARAANTAIFGSPDGPKDS